jgi:polyisoprenoid-binding protein YceI
MASNLWDIDVDQSAIRFWVRHMVVTKVRGRFDRWSGNIALDEADLTRSSVAVRIDAASIAARWTAPELDVADRDARLRSPAFLDVARYPEIAFRSKRIEKADSGYRIVGDLSLHGVEREVALEAEFAGVARDPRGGERARFSARTAFNRRDFGLVWDSAMEAGSIVVGANVGVAIEIEAVKKVAAASAAA